jgi:hypothetical protein
MSIIIIIIIIKAQVISTVTKQQAGITRQMHK